MVSDWESLGTCQDVRAMLSQSQTTDVRHMARWEILGTCQDVRAMAHVRCEAHGLMGDFRHISRCESNGTCQTDRQTN